VVIGRIGEKTWSRVITYRGPAIRIISFCRLLKEEAALYARKVLKDLRSAGRVESGGKGPGALWHNKGNIPE